MLNVQMTSASTADSAADRKGIEDAVRRYFATVADLESTEDQLRLLLSSEVRIVEHPNLVTPRGARRDLESTVAGFNAGKALLTEQAFDIHEVLVAGDRAAVRATWRGTVGVDAGPFRAGQELAAHIAAHLRFEDGLVIEHETYDCYEPITA